MADGEHDKFVLKERQKLQAREKALEKREAEAERLKAANADLEAQLKAKTGEDSLRARAVAAEAQVNELQRQLRQKASIYY